MKNLSPTHPINAARHALHTALEERPSPMQTIRETTAYGNRLLFALRVLDDDAIDFNEQTITITLSSPKQGDERNHD